MAAEQKYTREGFEKLKEEYERRTKVERERILNAIAEARSFGDLSENAEYDAARNEQASNEGEILELDYKLKNHAVYGVPPQDVDFVTFGVRVTVYDDVFDEEEVYEITGSMEANIEENKISNESPMGASLFGHKCGETVTVHLPNGNTYELVIKNVELA